MSAVHQFVPMLHEADAVGQHTQCLQDLLRAAGFESEIYVERDDPGTAGRTRSADAYRARPDDVLVYQLATASDMVPWLLEQPGRIVVNYHNVTPPALMAAWDNSLARLHVRAAGELAALATRAVLGIAVSEVNRADLHQAGFAATEVVPPLVPLVTDGSARTSGSVAAPAHSGRRQGGRWLVVGRLAPNKAVEDTMAALFVYRRRHDPGATLLVVGRPALAAYADALHAYRVELGLTSAVTFAGRVDEDRLRDAYRSADVLVVTSEHEGFCLPLVEAMSHGLPVVAYGAPGVREVLGDAGVLLDTKDPHRLADAVHGVLTDPDRRAELVAAGSRRLAALHLDTAGERMVDVLRKVASDPA